MVYNKLKQRRENILKKWKEAALANYLNSAFRSPGNENDRFGNPVVYNITRNLEIILDELNDRIHTARTDEALEDIIKIKSLQVEKPSAAVEFMVRLKDIIGKEVGSGSGEEKELPDLYAAIDRLALDGFDYFMKSRETIYDIRTKEIQRRSYKLLQRAGIGGVASGQEGGMDDDGN